MHINGAGVAYIRQGEEKCEDQRAGGRAPQDELDALEEESPVFDVESVELEEGEDIQGEAVSKSEPVQNTALNGAQVSSLLEIIQGVGSGMLSKESAEPLIRAAFPGIPDALITQMLANVKEIAPSGLATKAE